ncbi:MAG: excinuclease ABC subunit UvrA [Planctomycetota bacterium]
MATRTNTSKKNKKTRKQAKSKTTQAKQTKSTATSRNGSSSGKNGKPGKNGNNGINSASAAIAAAVAPTVELDHIEVRGAAEHNLKHVNVDIPKRKLICFTGVSGSGKTSLAFDTIFAEGQRRYVESLSAYARQFLGQMDKPKYETIRGLAPTISIEQKTASKNPRSTVGTITEIHDYLRVLWARAGVQFCHICGKEVGRGDAEGMVDEMLRHADGTKVLLLAPLIENRKGEHKEIFQQLKAIGFSRVRIDGIVHELNDVTGLTKNKKHNIEVVVDRLVIKRDDESFRKRLTDSVETSLRHGNGRLILHVLDREDIPYSEERSCCGHAFPALEPSSFSFNNPVGMCQHCNGLGISMEADEAKLIPDPSLTIKQGAVAFWRNKSPWDGGSGWQAEVISALQKQFKLDYDKPWSKLPQAQRDLILHGSNGREFVIKWKGSKMKGEYKAPYRGLLANIERQATGKYSGEKTRERMAAFMTVTSCPECKGSRLRPESVAVKIAGRTIVDLSRMTIGDAHEFVFGLKLPGSREQIARELLKEIGNRLRFLVNVGLEYLSLDRPGPTLSGGEAQRIRLASQVGSELTGVIYVLDEPSIGLHPRDGRRLIDTLKHLRDIGNTVLVVEHDPETIEAADYIVDFGPGAGHLGGQVIFSGPSKALLKDKHSLTGQYLSGSKQIVVPAERRKPPKGKDNALRIVGATEHNLKNVTCEIPLGVFTAVTGVSGAGKSTLINQILWPAMARHLHDSSEGPIGKHKEIVGLEHFDKCINIDQRPIGRTPRSNPATYTKCFDLIRDFFTLLPESAVRGYKAGRFSFNVAGGRCENCQGAGLICHEMHFLADVWTTCDVCHGKRFNRATLEVRYHGHNISDVLDMSIAEAHELFKDHPKIESTLSTLMDVGMGYAKLGQSATTLSGGEAQRIKLSRELARRDTGRTLYILDEPTTGLHFDDVNKLLAVLHRLVDGGNTVVVIEHNLDVIKTADWIIDLGPEGGAAGGYIIAAGTPEDVAAGKTMKGAGSHTCYTASFLAETLGTR